MKTQTIAFLLFLLCSLSLSAQKNSWTIGFHTGVQGQILTTVEQLYLGVYSIGGVERNGNGWDPPVVRIMHIFSNIPPIELTVKYNIGNFFSIATGLGYRDYYMKIWNNSLYNFMSRYDYLQIPIIFQYDVPFKKKGFAFFVQGGIAIDIEVGYTERIDYFDEYYYGVSGKQLQRETFTESFSNKGGTNALLFGGFGFSYKFNSGIGISLLGRYNIGAVHINNYSYHTIVREVETNIVEQENKVQLYDKAESWNVLLGVSYTFKQKKKEKE
jgi:hypothetical protein